MKMMFLLQLVMADGGLDEDEGLDDDADDVEQVESVSSTSSLQLSWKPPPPPESIVNRIVLRSPLKGEKCMSSSVKLTNLYSDISIKNHSVHFVAAVDKMVLEWAHKLM